MAWQPCCSAEGDAEGVARLSAFVLEYYAAWRETHEHATGGPWRAALSRLPGRTAATYREAARGLDMNSMLAGLTRLISLSSAFAMPVRL